MKSFYDSAKKSGGFSLLEVLIAIFILVIGIVGAYSAFNSMMANSAIAKERLTAAYLAQEGIEIVRNIRDANWLNYTGTMGWNNYTVPYFTSSPHDCRASTDVLLPGGYYNGGCEADYKAEAANGALSFGPWASPGTFLYIDSANGYSYTGTSKSIFKRQIIVNTVSGFPDALDIVVNVYWQDRGKTYNFPLEGYLYNWDTSNQ